MLKHYELTYTAQKNILPEEANNLLEKIASYLPPPPIKKEAGYSFFTLEFYAEPEAIAELAKRLKSEPQIEKYMITKVEKMKVIKTRSRKVSIETPVQEQKVEKVELKEIDKKLKEIFGE